MQIHLDPVGGAAGDMVIAALLDAFPEYKDGALDSIRRAVPDVDCQAPAHNDGVLQGLRFVVSERHGRDHHGHHHDHDHADHDDGHRHHGHRAWKDIRAHLQACGLQPAVAAHALAIFSLLAEAEGRVHGIAAEDVEFHEVGAWDSIADIVGAAHLVAAIGAERWTVGPLPLGSGRVKTAHGLLPVPAPATALLMEGFDTLDDGVAGERVTPTGMAILRHLCRNAAPASGARRLTVSGVGFGARRLPGLSNCLRVLAFDTAATQPDGDTVVVEFEIDDQTAEDLAIGLDRLRALPGVLDAVQSAVFGKKGRMMTAVRLLAAPPALDAVIAAVFRETTTIGLRHHRVARAVLPRREAAATAGGRAVRVKVVERPDGPSAKAAADDVAGEHRDVRQALRQQAEAKALKP